MNAPVVLPDPYPEAERVIRGCTVRHCGPDAEGFLAWMERGAALSFARPKRLATYGENTPRPVPEPVVPRKPAAEARPAAPAPAPAPAPVVSRPDTPAPKAAGKREDLAGRDKRLAAMWAEGASIEDIADRFGMTPGGVKTRRRALGLPARRVRDPEARRDRFVAVASPGRTIREVAELTGTTWQSAYNALKAYDLPWKPDAAAKSGRRRRKAALPVAAEAVAAAPKPVPAAERKRVMPTRAELRAHRRAGRDAKAIAKLTGFTAAEIGAALFRAGL